MVAETGDIPLSRKAAPKKGATAGFFVRLRKRLLGATDRRKLARSEKRAALEE